jgi:hypothetical protein
LRFLGCVVAAYLFLDPTAASALAPAVPTQSAAADAVPAAMPEGGPPSVPTPADERCQDGGVSRAASRGTLPDTGGGRSLPPLYAAAGLLVAGLAFRVVAARLRRRETTL